MAPDPLLAGAAPGHAQHPYGLNAAVSRLRLSLGPPRQGGSSGFHRVDGIGLARPPPLLAVGAVHLDDAHALVVEVAGQAGPVAAGALDANHDDGAEALKPGQQPAITEAVGRERLDAEQAADGVEGGDDMDVEVGVDPSGDLIWHGGHGSSLLSLGGDGPAGRDGGQDNDGPGGDGQTAGRRPARARSPPDSGCGGWRRAGPWPRPGG